MWPASSGCFVLVDDRRLQRELLLLLGFDAGVPVVSPWVQPPPPRPTPRSTRDASPLHHHHEPEPCDRGRVAQGRSDTLAVEGVAWLSPLSSSSSVVKMISMLTLEGRRRRTGGALVWFWLWLLLLLAGVRAVVAVAGVIESTRNGVDIDIDDGGFVLTCW